MKTGPLLEIIYFIIQYFSAFQALFTNSAATQEGLTQKNIVEVCSLIRLKTALLLSLFNLH